MITRYLCFLTIILAAFPLSAQPAAAGKVDGELIVELEDGATVQSLLQRLGSQRAAAGSFQHIREVAASFNIHLLRYDTTVWGDTDILDWLARQREVRAAQYNYRVEPRQAPNDPQFDRQWGANRIGAPAVWDVTTGGLTATGDTIVVAVLDFGFDINHEDMQENVWINRHEIPGDGVDNDNNGFIDDLYGWNFLDESNELSTDIHGQSVAGLIGARGNNGIGVAGINWDVKMMLLAIQYVDEIISAYEYVIEQRQRYNQSKGTEGAFVVATNASFGLSNTFCDEQPVWGGMYDKLGETGILTGASTINSEVNVDLAGDMPTTCESDFILTVTNMTILDEKYTPSGFGEVAIDMGAPGQNSFTLSLGNRYHTFSGTSASAPHLTGAIALLYALPCESVAQSALETPRQTALFFREAIINGAEPLPQWEGLTATGGVLNVFNAMEFIRQSCVTETGELDILSLYPNPASSTLFVEYITPEFEPYDFRMYNALGQEVYRNTEVPKRFSQNVHEIDVSNLAPGIYFVAIRRGDAQVVEAVVVR